MGIIHARRRRRGRRQLRCGKFGVGRGVRGGVAGREWAPAFAGVGIKRGGWDTLILTFSQDGRRDKRALRQAQDERIVCGAGGSRAAPTSLVWVEV